MIKNNIDILSEYYQYELSYLRSAGADFAARFPKIARRLDMSGNESNDPQVERLIESFAFLSGKLQKQIDDQFPEISKALLDVMYQPLILPTPSCVMVNCDVDIMRAAKAPGSIIPKNTILRTTSHSGEMCSFSTSHDLRIWPLEITSASIIQKENIPSYYAEATYYLKLDIEYEPSNSIPNNLKFYILADSLLRSKIFSAIFSTDLRIVYQKDDNFKFLNNILPIGNRDEESLLNYPQNIHKGFRILHEYFSFPEKFYGFEVALNPDVDISGKTSILIPMSYDISMQISEKNFSLSSVPAINLFPKISEPLRMDSKQVEYCLIPDYRKYSSNEIYSIEKLVAVDSQNNDEILVPEFFSCDHMEEDVKYFWVSKRKPTYLKDYQGEDIYISVIDTNFLPQYPADRIFYAHTLCTNRYAAEQIPANGELQIDISAPIKSIYCYERPTVQKSSISQGQILWKLISALSLNSLSFHDNGIEKIKELLSVFVDISKSSIAQEVDAITSINTSISTQRINEQAWRGIIRGTDVEITFDDTIPNLGLPLSFVLSKFLAHFTSINTFTNVVTKNISKHMALKKWNQKFDQKNYL